MLSVGYGPPGEDEEAAQGHHAKPEAGIDCKGLEGSRIQEGGGNALRLSPSLPRGPTLCWV